MNVKISVDIIESMLRLHQRRGENQNSIYGLLLGVVTGYNTYQVEECLYRFIYYNTNYKHGKVEDSNKKVSNLYYKYDLIKYSFLKH